MVELQVQNALPMSLDDGTAAAKQITKAMQDRKLTVNIRGKQHVTADAWAMAGGLLGLTAREVETVEHSGTFVSTIEIVRIADGVVVSRASSQCGTDEPMWKSRPAYARRSMAITRATSKAFRLCVGWIVALAGFETTAAEEMDGVDAKPASVVTIKANRHSQQPNDPADPGQVEAIKLKADEAGLSRDELRELFGRHGIASPKHLTGDAAGKIAADLGTMILENSKAF